MAQSTVHGRDTVSYTPLDVYKRQIFISIDDKEQENLRKVCDEIFGMQNFVAQLVWERAYACLLYTSRCV